VFFVNLPMCAIVVVGALRLLGDRDRDRTASRKDFDVLGASLVTAGMLLLVYAIVEAPSRGWGDARTIGELAGALALLGVFAVHEQRRGNPLFPFSIFRIKGLAAADATQVIAMAGFLGLFFFLTLYMQTVLGDSPVQAGAAYLPTTAAVLVTSVVSAQLVSRTGTRPIIVIGTLLGAAGVYWLSRIPVHGAYVTDILPGRRHLAHPASPRGPRRRAGRAHRRLPASVRGGQHPPARRRRDRAASDQHPRRTDRRSGRRAGPGRRLTTGAAQRATVICWRLGWLPKYAALVTNSARRVARVAPNATADGLSSPSAAVARVTRRPLRATRTSRLGGFSAT
jgi:hypothetical protein